MRKKPIKEHSRKYGKNRKSKAYVKKGWGY